jgi:hypothetical protein
MIKRLLADRITLVWLLLIVITLATWESVGVTGGARLATFAVLVIAFVKVRFIGLEFMELRHAPLPLRIAFEAWTVIMCATLVTLYALAPLLRSAAG